MSAVLESLTGGIKELDAKAIDEYWELVKRIASDRKVTPEQARAALHAANRTAEQLADDVKVCKRRDQLRAELAELPNLQTRKEGLERQRDAEQAKLDEATRKYNEAIAPLRFEIDNINEALRAASGYQAELLNTCPVEEFDEQARVLREKTAEVEQQLSQAQRAEQNCQAQLRQAQDEQQRSDSAVRRADVAECKDIANAASKRVAELQAELTALVEQSEEVAREQCAF